MYSEVCHMSHLQEQTHISCTGAVSQTEIRKWNLHILSLTHLSSPLHFYFSTSLFNSFHYCLFCLLPSPHSLAALIDHSHPFCPHLSLPFNPSSPIPLCSPLKPNSERPISLHRDFVAGAVKGSPSGTLLIYWNETRMASHPSLPTLR